MLGISAVLISYMKSQSGDIHDFKERTILHVSVPSVLYTRAKVVIFTIFGFKELLNMSVPSVFVAKVSNPVR